MSTFDVSWVGATPNLIKDAKKEAKGRGAPMPRLLCSGVPLRIWPRSPPGPKWPPTSKTINEGLKIPWSVH